MDLSPEVLLHSGVEEILHLFDAGGDGGLLILDGGDARGEGGYNSSNS